MPSGEIIDNDDGQGYARVWELIRPNPERLATAKEALSRRLLERGGIGRFGSDLAIEQGAQHESQIREKRDPANQPALIEYWAWELAGRETLWEFHDPPSSGASYRVVSPGGVAECAESTARRSASR